MYKTQKEYFEKFVLRSLLEGEILNKTLFPNHDLGSMVSKIRRKYAIAVQSFRVNNGISCYLMMPRDIAIFKQASSDKQPSQCESLNTGRSNNSYEHLLVAPWLRHKKKP